MVFFFNASHMFWSGIEWLFLFVSCVSFFVILCCCQFLLQFFMVIKALQITQSFMLNKSHRSDDNHLAIALFPVYHWFCKLDFILMAHFPKMDTCSLGISEFISWHVIIVISLNFRATCATHAFRKSLKLISIENIKIFVELHLYHMECYCTCIEKNQEFCEHFCL